MYKLKSLKVFLLAGRLIPVPRSAGVIASTPLSALKAKPRVEKAKHPRKKIPAIKKPRSDDVMLALGISVSQEVQRRKDDGFISTQHSLLQVLHTPLLERMPDRWYREMVEPSKTIF